MSSFKNDSQGFTLVELMVVVGMMGLVMTAIYSTFLTNQKTATSQGEVAEVQQNLRVALDMLSRDITMAGAMIPTGTGLYPVASASGSPVFPTYSSSIMINTASAEGRFARVEQTPVVPAASVPLQVEAPASSVSPNIVDGFAVGDKVRLIRPVDGSQPLSDPDTLRITAISRGTFGSTNPSITLTNSSGFLSTDIINPGDMIAKIDSTSISTYPMTVAYYLVNGGTAINGFSCPANEKCLVRQVNGQAALSDIVATNISSLRFGYLDDGYHEANTPGDLSKVRAVRVTLQGATARTAVLSSGAKNRAITTIIKLRNRR